MPQIENEAENESQNDGQHQRIQVWQIECSTNNDTHYLTNAAAQQAVQGGAVGQAKLCCLIERIFGCAVVMMLQIAGRLYS